MSPITLGHYLSLGGILFALSVIGIFLNRRNLIVLLMAIELMLLAVNLNFVAFSHYLPVEADRMAGQVFVFFILTVAAVLLLVAIVAAIALTLRRRKDGRFQNPNQQVRVRAADRVRLVKMDPVVSVPSAPAAGTEGAKR